MGIEDRGSIGTGTSFPILPESLQNFNFRFLVSIHGPPTGRRSCQTLTKKRPPEVFTFNHKLKSNQSLVWSNMDVRRRSKVWLNFTKQNGTSARCTICDKIVSCTGGCTSNMIKHLRGNQIEINVCPVFDVLRTSSTASSSGSLPGSDPQPGTAVTALQSQSGR